MNEVWYDSCIFTSHSFFYFTCLFFLFKGDKCKKSDNATVKIDCSCFCFLFRILWSFFFFTGLRSRETKNLASKKCEMSTSRVSDACASVVSPLVNT